jgi:hypothetical protein
MVFTIEPDRPALLEHGHSLFSRLNVDIEAGVLCGCGVAEDIAILPNDPVTDMQSTWHGTERQLVDPDGVCASLRRRCGGEQYKGGAG